MSTALLSRQEVRRDPPASRRSAPQDPLLETVIEPQPGWKAVNLAELWRYRELLFFLTWRDIKIRYKQSLMGAAWAILQPLMYMIVFSVVFGRLARVDTYGIPYPLFAFAGLLPWSFFAAGITQAGNSVVGSSPLITKVYLPRLAIPFASVGAALFDFFVACSVLAALTIYYMVWPVNGATVTLGWSLLMLPLLVMLTMLAALGVGTWLGALSVAYRDFKHAIPFLVQLWMFATPAIYMGTKNPSASSVPPPAAVAAANDAAEDVSSHPVRSGSRRLAAAPSRPPVHEGVVDNRIQSVLELNPMMGLIRSFRAALLGLPMPWIDLARSTGIVLAVFLGGCFYFHRVEDTFADII